MYVFAIISLGLFVIAGVSSVLFWFVGMYHFVAMISNKRWEARGKWWSSGFMTIYIPSALTEAGRMHRRRGFLSFAGFFCFSRGRLCCLLWLAADQDMAFCVLESDS
jgi:hypothetical protein